MMSTSFAPPTTPLEKVLAKAVAYEKEQKYAEAARIISKGAELCPCQFITTPPSIPPTSRSRSPRVWCSCRDLVGAVVSAPAPTGSSVPPTTTASTFLTDLFKQPCKCPARKWTRSCATSSTSTSSSSSSRSSSSISSSSGNTNANAHEELLAKLTGLLIRTKDLGGAKEAVGWLLELSRGVNPDAYLRLGQILRLENPGNEAAAGNALRVYSAGVEVVGGDKKARKEKREQFEALKKMRDKLSVICRHQRRNDPVAKFPPEILEMIFRHFDIAEMSQFLRVSRIWSRRLNNEPRLWRHLRFINPGSGSSGGRKGKMRKDPGITVIKEICRRSQYTAKSLVLENTRWTASGNLGGHDDLTAAAPGIKKFREVIRLSPRLEVLRICEPRQRACGASTKAVIAGWNALFKDPVSLKALRHVYFGLHTPVQRWIMLRLATLAGKTVESLTMLHAEASLTMVIHESPDVSPSSNPLEWTSRFENLRSLRLGQPADFKRPMVARQLAHSTPQLRQFVSDCPFYVFKADREFVPGSDPEEPPIWQHLEVFRAFGDQPSPDFLVKQNLLDPKNLVVFDSNYHLPISLAPEPRTLDKLKHYHVNENLCLESVETALRSKSFEFFGLDCRVLHDSEWTALENSYSFESDLLPLFSDPQHRPGIRGLEVRIQYWLDFHEVAIQNILKLVGQCPEVESVSINTVEEDIQPSKLFAVLGCFKDIVATGRVKVLHENCLKGQVRDEFVDFARERGVEVKRMSPLEGGGNTMEVPMEFGGRDWTKPFAKPKAYTWGPLGD
ncbi:hypothetical protein MKZ38_008798 [Zalerion maritima]|uniref:F-box domain-containing protein n=1 Tax=Zalerion maritima TaxID=339359 RepID=A0AAD5RGV8_9PEZI|nr:hypothetical protein MKZ38_008798 [Zalerion maritima]